MIPHYAIVLGDGSLKFEFEKQQRAYCLKQFGAGACLDVEIREHRDKRSDRQNRAMWALLNAWCKDADQGWRPDDLKDAVMGTVFGTLEITMPITGEVKRVLARPSTSSLNVTDFCAVIEAILELAATSEPSVYLQAPDEYRKAKELAQRRRHGSRRPHEGFTGAARLGWLHFRQRRNAGGFVSDKCAHQKRSPFGVNPNTLFICEKDFCAELTDAGDDYLC